MTEGQVIIHEAERDGGWWTYLFIRSAPCWLLTFLIKALIHSWAQYPHDLSPLKAHLPTLLHRTLNFSMGFWRGLQTITHTHNTHTHTYTHTCICILKTEMFFYFRRHIFTYNSQQYISTFLCVISFIITWIYDPMKCFLMMAKWEMVKDSSKIF
jgi:hypothetical protein